MNSAGKSDLRQIAQQHWAAGNIEAALHQAWAAYGLDPQDRDSKRLLAGLIDQFPAAIDPDKKSDLFRLLGDPEMDPDYISKAGWFLILRGASWHAAASN